MLHIHTHTHTEKQSRLSLIQSTYNDPIKDIIMRAVGQVIATPGYPEWTHLTTASSDLSRSARCDARAGVSDIVTTATRDVQRSCSMLPVHGDE